MTAGNIGFVGLGVMGEPMCAHLARKSGRQVFGYDVADAPFASLAQHGVRRVPDLTTLGKTCDVVFLALPSGKHVEGVCSVLVAVARHGQTIVDFGTTSVATTRRLAGQFAERGTAFADAPIARTRQAAIDADLSVMVGADTALFAVIRPLLATFASDVTHCGGVGAGQVVKIMNNMVLTQTVVALGEALTVARAAGLDGAMLFQTLMKGSADSFALRNHGMKALLPGVFPERAFSVEYMRKDLGYALELAQDAGVAVPGAELADSLLARAMAAGNGDRYWPVLAQANGKAG